jgi:hypothetical protein
VLHLGYTEGRLVLTQEYLVTDQVHEQGNLLDLRLRGAYAVLRAEARPRVQNIRINKEA